MTHRETNSTRLCEFNRRRTQTRWYSISHRALATAIVIAASDCASGTSNAVLISLSVVTRSDAKVYCVGHKGALRHIAESICSHFPEWIADTRCAQCVGVSILAIVNGTRRTTPSELT